MRAAFGRGALEYSSFDVVVVLSHYLQYLLLDGEIGTGGSILHARYAMQYPIHAKSEATIIQGNIPPNRGLEDDLAPTRRYNEHSVARDVV